MTRRGSFRNGSTRQSAPGSTNAKSASSSPQSPNLRFGLEPHLDREAARYGWVTNPAVPQVEASSVLASTTVAVGACPTNVHALDPARRLRRTQGSPNRTWHGNTLDIETKPR
jgi:hypothetical protein